MFCPTCGRDNPIERKFCASCGTNLEAVSQALAGSEDDFFTRIDAGLDHFLAKYAEHVFKNAPLNAAEQRVGKSWQVLGQAVVTSITDVLLFSLMWNIIPLRFLLLLISSPIRLLSEQGKNKRRALASGNLPGGRRARDLPDPMPQQWLSDSVGSVTEHTTVLLPDSERRSKN
jgi:Double zinc ribbon